MLQAPSRFGEFPASHMLSFAARTGAHMPPQPPPVVMDQSQAVALQQQQQMMSSQQQQQEALYQQQQQQWQQRFGSVLSNRPPVHALGPSTSVGHNQLPVPPGGPATMREKSPIQMVQNMLSGLPSTLAPPGQSALQAVVMQHDATSPRRGRRKSASSDSSGRSSARPASRSDAELMQHPAVMYDAMGNLHCQPLMQQQQQQQHGVLLQNRMTSPALQAAPGMMMHSQQQLMFAQGPPHPGQLMHGTDPRTQLPAMNPADGSVSMSSMAAAQGTPPSSML